MADTHKPNEAVGQAEGEQKAPEEKKNSKTLQELERLQFDALDRAGFEN